MIAPITVHKRDHHGKHVLSYGGTVMQRGESWVQLEAFFGFEFHDSGFVTYQRGDRFVEWFYTDRWYNVFQIFSVLDGSLKGWYCNVTRPAVIGADSVAADDLALDVFIHPDYTVRVLDEDEFSALELMPAERTAALEAVDQLKALAASRTLPDVSVK